MNDLNTYLGDIRGANGSFRTESGKEVNVTKKGDNLNLDMTSFLQIMIAELTNQGIDDTMDTSDMINQMVQMQMIQALVNMTQATTMSYSASLVGKEVTVGQRDDEGNLQEIVGTVTGTGTYNDSPIIFLDNNEKFYYLSDIMAVGRLPEKTETEESTDPTYGGENGTPQTPEV